MRQVTTFTIYCIQQTDKVSIFLLLLLDTFIHKNQTNLIHSEQMKF